jgi:hypothetical protein
MLKTLGEHMIYVLISGLDLVNSMYADRNIVDWLTICAAFLAATCGLTASPNLKRVETWQPLYR